MKLYSYLSKCFAILLFVALTNVAQASDPPLSIEGLSKSESKLFIEGAAWALSVYDMNMQQEKKNRLFCLPKNRTPDSQFIWQMASNELAGPHEKQFLIIAAISAMKVKYPCPK